MVGKYSGKAPYKQFIPQLLPDWPLFDAYRQREDKAGRTPLQFKKWQVEQANRQKEIQFDEYLNKGPSWMRSGRHG